MAVKHAVLSARHVSTILPASGIQRTPHLLYHGLQTAQSNPGHASLSAVTHHPHREELVGRFFFNNLSLLGLLLFQYFFFLIGNLIKNRLILLQCSMQNRYLRCFSIPKQCQQTELCCCFNRFHYAARIWDGVKKSSALSEYSRLLS